MMTQYLYPQNLKATANLWLWSLKDFAILGVMALPSIVLLVQFGFLLPAAAVLCYGFLTIRMDDTTIMEFLKCAVRYFLTTEQYYEWR
jgi:predicted membrane metal-binding protein